MQRRGVNSRPVGILLNALVVLSLVVGPVSAAAAPVSPGPAPAAPAGPAPRPDLWPLQLVPPALTPTASPPLTPTLTPTPACQYSHVTGPPMFGQAGPLNMRRWVDFRRKIERR